MIISKLEQNLRNGIEHVKLRFDLLNIQEIIFWNVGMYAHFDFHSLPSGVDRCEKHRSGSAAIAPASLAWGNPEPAGLNAEELQLPYIEKDGRRLYVIDEHTALRQSAPLDTARAAFLTRGKVKGGDGVGIGCAGVIRCA